MEATPLNGEMFEHSVHIFIKSLRILKQKLVSYINMIERVKR